MLAKFVDIDDGDIVTIRSGRVVPRGDLIQASLTMEVRKSSQENVLMALRRYGICANATCITNKRVRIKFEATFDPGDGLQALLDHLSRAISVWIQEATLLCSQIAPEYRF